MSGDFLERARRFAALHAVELGEELGAGTQGVVFTIVDKTGGDWTALKVHYHAHSFEREWAVYRRLAERDVFDVAGFAVPRLGRVDAALLAIEMSIVRPPFVVDFAGAWIDDEPPEFSEEVLRDWESEKREQFGERWPTVQRVIAEFRALGIHLLDVSPGNIAFRD
jgi:hypothetical protein